MKHQVRTESDGINDAQTDSKSKRMNVWLSNQTENRKKTVKVHIKSLIWRITRKWMESDGFHLLSRSHRLLTLLISCCTRKSKFPTCYPHRIYYCSCWSAAVHKSYTVKCVCAWWLYIKAVYTLFNIDTYTYYIYIYIHSSYKILFHRGIYYFIYIVLLYCICAW